MRYSIIIALIFLFAYNVKAQDKFNLDVNTGVATALLDSGIGFHLGVNPRYDINRFLSLEGQLSYTYVKINGSFISGNTGRQMSTNLLGGGRVYFLKPEKRIRPYFNFLLGGAYFDKVLGNPPNNYENKDFLLGYSSGIFIETRKGINTGIALETNGVLVAKIGYGF